MINISAIFTWEFLLLLKTAIFYLTIEQTTGSATT